MKDIQQKEEDMLNESEKATYEETIKRLETELLMKDINQKEDNMLNEQEKATYEERITRLEAELSVKSQEAGRRERSEALCALSSLFAIKN